MSSYAKCDGALLKFAMTFLFIFFIASLSFGQLANANFGLRNKMGISINHEITRGSFNGFNLQQQHSNVQAFLPLFIKVDTTTTKPSVAILKADYTFRHTQNTFNQVEEQIPFSSNFYTNSLALSFVHTIGYPFFINYSARFTYAGDYKSYNPLHFSATGTLIYRFSNQLKVGAGILFQQSENKYREFLFIPYIDWRINKHWFLDMTTPTRLIIGRNIGHKKTTQIALGSYLEFITRYAFTINNVQKIIETTDISIGIDFRTQLHRKLFFNAFVGNNFYKAIRFKSDEIEILTKSNEGVNIKLGLSLNLE